MSKIVKVIVNIPRNGKIKVHTEGTKGEECMNLLSFTKYIEDLLEEKTERVENDDDGTSKNVLLNYINQG